MRRAQVKRTTKETDIDLTLDLDGAGEASISTGFGFADHMLTLLAFWGGIDLAVECKGDLEVDAHHSLEDVGLALGEALVQALGDKRGIRRVGFARVPMDEACAEANIDFSGRPYLVYGDEAVPDVVAGEERDVWREFFKSLAFRGGLNLHLNILCGQNGHHMLEAAFKAVGLALKEGAAQTGDRVPSTKGSLD